MYKEQARMTKGRKRFKVVSRYEGYEEEHETLLDAVTDFMYTEMIRRDSKAAIVIDGWWFYPREVMPTIIDFFETMSVDDDGIKAIGSHVKRW